MNKLEYFKKTYGEEKVKKVFDYLKNDQRHFKNLYNFLQFSEYSDKSNCSCQKTKIISKLNEIIDDKMFLYDFCNTISECDLEFNIYDTIITYGTFDLFHIGHLKLLKRIKSMCNNLIVAVSTDEFNLLKGKKCVIPFDERAAIVNGLKYVTKVIPENNWEQKIEDIKKYKVDAFVMGDDWEGKFDYLKEYCDVIYLSRTEGISTSSLKEKLKN